MPMLHFEINHKTHTQCYLILLLLLSPIGLVGGGGVRVCCQQQTMGGWLGGGCVVVGEGGQWGTLLMLNKLVSIQ